MDRRVRGSCAMVASLVLATVSVACSVAPEEKIVKDFFRASRMRDNATLGSFATASFEPATDGQVQSLKVLDITPERANPLPLLKFSKVFDEAKAAEDSFVRQKNDYQRTNIEAIQRVVEAERKNKPIPRKDATIQTAWTKWREDASKYSKAVSDARSKLNNLKGLAELSLSQPHGPTPDVTKLSGDMVEKNITVEATVRQPDASTATKTLVVTLERCVMKNDAGQTRTGRWIVTRVREPKAQKTT
jgi:hypothetical protein